MSDQAERDALAARIVQAQADPPILEQIARSDEIARKTLQSIVDALVDARSERDELDARIRALVEAEAIWGPIVNRLERGIVRRKTDDDGTPTLPV